MITYKLLTEFLAGYDLFVVPVEKIKQLDHTYGFLFKTTVGQMEYLSRRDLVVDDSKELFEVFYDMINDNQIESYFILDDSTRFLFKTFPSYKNVFIEVIEGKQYYLPLIIL